MGWDNPPVPWREFERRLSWGKGTGQEPREEPRQSVTRLPVGPQSPADREAGRELAGAELHCHSSYSFLDGASSPADLVCEAASRGLSALAITDHDGMYGVPQFAQAAARLREGGIRLGTVFGAELSLDLARRAGVSGRRSSARAAARPAGTQEAQRTGTQGTGTRPAGTRPAGTPRAGVPDPVGRHLLILARDPEGYRRLCRVISA